MRRHMTPGLWLATLIYAFLNGMAVAAVCVTGGPLLPTVVVILLLVCLVGGETMVVYLLKGHD